MSNKRNVCFVIPLPPPYGGITNWSTMLCDYLDKYEKEHIQYTVINTSPKKRMTEGRKLSERLIYGILDSLKIVHQLRKLLKAGEIDCVHITTSGSLSLLRDLAVCRVVSQYDVSIVYHIHFGRIPSIYSVDNWEKKVLHKIIHQSRSVISIDKKTYDCLRNFGYRNIEYIPNPIDIRTMPEPVSEKRKVVMYLGWVIKEKGIEELLGAWEKVYPEYSEWKLELVGPYKTEYLEYLQGRFKLEGVNILGEKPHNEAMDLLNQSEIFVLPSHSEGCPYVILEAMALGKTIIATDVGNIPEMLSGECGRVVAPYKSDELVEVIARLMKDKYQFGERAHKKVSDKFEISYIVGCYKKIWNVIS